MTDAALYIDLAATVLNVELACRWWEKHRAEYVDTMAKLRYLRSVGKGERRDRLFPIIWHAGWICNAALAVFCAAIAVSRFF